MLAGTGSILSNVSNLHSLEQENIHENVVSMLFLSLGCRGDLDRYLPYSTLDIYDI